MAEDKLNEVADQLQKLAARMPTYSERTLETVVNVLLDEGTTPDKLYELVDQYVDNALDRHAVEDEDAHANPTAAHNVGHHERLKAVGRKCSVCEPNPPAASPETPKT